ncbi:MAG: TlpA family protein disulfide reductase [Chloroflexi bacterium]|nr:TlpA family protein disulfide reductase [Chloroflexota bacterium]MYE42170.1 TlpA family protein disulfide reductase [Chloroflexota bacterium]
MAGVSNMIYKNVILRAGLFLATGLLALLLACGGSDGDGEAVSTPDTDATVEARVHEEMVEATVDMQVAMTLAPTNTPILSEELAPDFLITVIQGQDTLGGEQVAMTSLVGEKPVVLNFWAAECPPCRAELPEFQSFHEEYGDRVLVLGVDLGQFTGQGTPEQGRELLAELGVAIPAGYTEDSEILPKYQVLGLPTTVFINADGSIHTKWTGALNEEVLVEKAEEMLDG